MTKKPNAEETLPSIAGDLASHSSQACLTLTIAFHPDTARIGQLAVLVDAEDDSGWALGRNDILFGSVGEAGELVESGPLDDLCVSRQAIQIGRCDDGVILQRPSPSSACRIWGEGLKNEIELSGSQLAAGVPLMLADRVVLLLAQEVLSDVLAPRNAAPVSLIGRSAYMNSLRREILSAGEVDSDVLICGETGTGKELVATAIYQHSARRSRPLVSVNMSAIPSALAPAALFGNAKGAYTGAERAGVGYFQRAEGGVLFLDEIGDTASDVQPQLLRAIQQREIQSIGGPVREIDLRIIAATDSNLEDPGEFKAALRHRLGSIQFLLKPLRSHSQDIGELLWDFMGTAFDSKSAALSLPGADSSSRDIANWAELFYLFLSYSWPGNVRQLANFANQVAIASDTSLTLPAQLRQELTSSCTQDEAISTERRSSRSVSHTEFCLAMEQANYEPAGVARVLRISRTAVYRRIEVSSEFCLAADIPRETLCSALEHASGDLLEAALDLRVSVVSLRSRASGLGLAVRY